MESQPQNENKEVKENKENISTKVDLEWTNKLDETVKHNLAIVEQKIKSMKQQIVPKDEFDDQVLNTLWWFQQEINRISQENNLEYSYVQFLYNLVQEYGDNIDLNKMNLAWHGRLLTFDGNEWQDFSHDELSYENIFSDISGKDPKLIFSNGHSVLESSNNIKNSEQKYKEVEKYYNIYWSMPIDTKDTTKQEKELEFVVDDIKNKEDIYWLALGKLFMNFAKTKVNGKIKSEMFSNNTTEWWQSVYKEGETFLQDSSVLQRTIVSDFKIESIDDNIKWKHNKGKWIVKIKFNLYS